MTPWSILSIHVEISFAFAELKESVTSQRPRMEWRCLLPAAVLPLPLVTPLQCNGREQVSTEISISGGPL